MATLERAIALAACKHEGQRDKEGQPYILHCLRAMMRVEGEEAQIAAVLHDVVEDTSTTTDDLRREGFSERIIAAVEALTHRHGDTYAEYVIRIAGNELARRVKLADLHDNTRLERAILRPRLLDRDLTRFRRYLLSYKFLTGQISANDYRHLMGDA